MGFHLGLAAAATVAVGIVGLPSVAGAVEVEPLDPASYPMGSRPVSLQVADFNGDGASDLVAADPPFDRVAVLLNEGDGSFSATALYPAGDQPGQIAVGDLNGDDAPDLALTNREIDSVSVLLNVNGGFPVVTTYAVGDIPASIAIGDVNDDGHADIAVANLNDGVLSVLHNNGAGAFALGQSLVLGDPGDLSSLKIADLNGDGHGDIAVTRAGNGEIALLFGDGSGTFAFVTPLVVGGLPSRLDLADMNGDGHVDLFVFENCGIGCHIREILAGAGNGTFTDFSIEGFGPNPNSMALGDVDGDGDVDIVTALQWPDDPNSILVELNEGFGRFDRQHLVTTGHLQSVGLGLFDGDDKLDLAAANNDIGTVWLWSFVPDPDTQPPVLTVTVDPGDVVASSGWYNAASSGTDGVKVNVSATDNVAVTNITCTADGVEVLNTAAAAASVVVGDGVHAVSCTASDGINISAPGTLNLQVDQTAPTISASVSPNPVPLGGSATPTAVPSDATSGVASSQCAAADTSTVGVKTLTCTATDIAGNSAEASGSYTVAYRFGGFQEPIPQASYSAGSVIPVKFTLLDHTGARIPDRDAQALVAACLIRVRLDGVLQPGCVKYDARFDQFLYNLRTPRALTGSHTVTIDVGAPNGSGTVNTNDVTIVLRR
jgi:hypothetical protein